MLDDPSIKPIVEAHYIVLWIDCGENVQSKRFENLNGEKLCKQIGIWTGFPSYATLDPSGNVLKVTGSLGYPDDAGGDHRFFEVLNAGPKPLTPAEQSAMQSYLTTHRM